MRCLGRLVSDTKGTGAIPFENGGFYHMPFQCDKVADGLCSSCQIKKERTDAKVAVMKGKSLQGSHPSFLHGLVTEPIPIWSHAYDGPWFHLKLAGGAIVSDMTKAKVAPAPAAPLDPVKRKFKIQKPKLDAPIATLKGSVEEPETILHIDVKKVEIDGRQVYLAADKVYDLKFKYIGRHDSDKIVPFPDSDAE